MVCVEVGGRKIKQKSKLGFIIFVFFLNWKNELAVYVEDICHLKLFAILDKTLEKK